MNQGSLTRAGTVLLGLDSTSPVRRDSLESLLRHRIVAFLAASNLDQPPELVTQTEEDLKRTTATYAASIISQTADLARHDSTTPRPSTSTATAPPPPLFGARDTKVLSMLSGVVGRWGIAARVQDDILPASIKDRTKRTPPTSTDKGSRFTEIVEEEEEGDDSGEGLEEIVKVVLDVVLLPKGVHRDSGSGQLAALVLPQLLLPLFGSLVQLAYGGERGVEWVSEPLGRLLRMNTPIVALSTLLALLSSASSTHAWLRPTLSNLLSAQLLRPGGVRSLLLLVAGNEEEVGLSKLEMLARLLGAAPSDQSPDTYFASIIPQLLAILQAAANSSIPTSAKSSSPPPIPPPESITRAAAFVFSTLVSQHPHLASLFLKTFDPTSYPQPLSSTIIPPATLLRALALLSLILLHSPPLPHLLPLLLSPLLPLLLSLSSFLSPPSASDHSPQPTRSIFAPDPQADERLRDEVDALLETYAKASRVDEAFQGLLRAVEVVERGREFDIAPTSLENDAAEGEEYYFARSEESGEVELRRKELGEEEEGEMRVRVDPEGVVRVLTRVGRKELSGRMFLRWLDEVQVLRSQDGIEAARRSVVRLQLVLKMVEEMGSELLEEPTQIIAFVAHALDASEPATSAGAKAKEPKEPNEPKAGGGLGLDDLRIVDEDDEEDMPGTQEDEGVVPGLGPDEMAVTALTLLLAVLEANEDLNMSTTPLLSLIFNRLDTLVDSPSDLIPPLAREARLVLSVRRATSFPPISDTPNTPDPHAESRATYQEALKLLQDPLLPLRAQGLILLRSLVASRSSLLSTDPALIPAILDIFIQAVEDDDSFLYLNAIQGLGALVDSYGRKVVLKLVEVLGGGRKGVDAVWEREKGRREMERRLRIGEAVVLVVQRAGEALALFVDDLIPTLLLILRTSTLPTPLRSSALTILATAIETAPAALIPYTNTLAESCLTLLSIESRPLQPRRPATESAPPPARTTTSSEEEEEEEEEEAPPQLDRHGKPKRPEETPEPASADAKKQPSLRRAAVLFLGLLFRAAARVGEERKTAGGGGGSWELPGGLGMGGMRIGRETGGAGGRERALVSGETRRRAKVVLGYVGQTDEDALVRHQAGEVLEEI